MRTPRSMAPICQASAPSSRAKNWATPWRTTDSIACASACCRRRRTSYRATLKQHHDGSQDHQVPQGQAQARGAKHGRLRRAQGVADPADSVNQGLTKGCVDFLAQVAHVDVDDVALDLGIAPDVRGQLLA